MDLTPRETLCLRIAGLLGVMLGLSALVLATVSDELRSQGDGFRHLLAILAGLLVVALLVLARSALRTGAARRLHATGVLGALALDLGGRAEGLTFEGRLGERALEVRAVGNGAAGTVDYLVRLALPLGARVEAVVRGADELARLARGAAGAPEVERSGLARSLLDNEPDWRALFRVFGVSELRFEGSVALVRASSGVEVLGVLDEATRLRRLLERLVHATAVAGAALAVTARSGAPERCPFCHDGFEEARATRDCPRCGTRHHEECWGEHGRCAVFACAPRPAAQVRAP